MWIQQLDKKKVIKQTITYQPKRKKTQEDPTKDEFRKTNICIIREAKKMKKKKTYI